MFPFFSGGRDLPKSPRSSPFFPKLMFGRWQITPPAPNPYRFFLHRNYSPSHLFTSDCLFTTSLLISTITHSHKRCTRSLGFAHAKSEKSASSCPICFFSSPLSLQFRLCYFLKVKSAGQQTPERKGTVEKREGEKSRMHGNRSFGWEGFGIEMFVHCNVLLCMAERWLWYSFKGAYKNDWLDGGKTKRVEKIENH